MRTLAILVACSTISSTTASAGDFKPLKAPERLRFPKGTPRHETKPDGTWVVPPELARQITRGLKDWKGFPRLCQVALDQSAQICQVAIDGASERARLEKPPGWDNTAIALGVGGGFILGLIGGLALSR